MTTPEIIRTARDHIANVGWHKGSARGPNLSDVCAVTAITIAARYYGCEEQQEHEEALALVEGLAPEHPRAYLRRLAAFNDHPSTSRQDVVDIFDKALAELGALGG